MGDLVRTIIIWCIALCIGTSLVVAEAPSIALQNGHQTLLAEFSSDITTGTGPLLIQFYDESSGSVEEWLWEFGDGTEASVKNPLHTYTTPGKYSVSLTINGLSGTDRKTRIGYVTVSAETPLHQQSTPLPTLVPVLPPLEVPSPVQTLTLAPTPDPAEISPTPEPEPADTPSSAVISNTDILNLLRSPVKAGYTASPSEGLAPLAVQFTDSSSGTPQSWVWDFGDGTSSDLQSPHHVFERPGTYSVSLTVRGAAGTDTILKEHSILATAEPQVGILAQPKSGSVPLTVAFTDNSTGRITAHHWKFGDGTESGESDPVHMYTIPGTYDVSLAVSGPDGDHELTMPALITVTDQIIAPTASIGVDLTQGTAPLTIRFTDTSTGDVTTRTWDFGDGTTASDLSTVHTFQKAGVYTPSLLIKGPAGDSRAEVQISVNDPAPTIIAGFSSDPVSGAAPLAVQFTDSSTGEISSWSWDFGDGSTSTEPSLTHTYAAAGTYPVVLTVSGPGGESRSTGTVSVTEPVPATVVPPVAPPVAGFSSDPVSGAAPLPVGFTDSSTGEISSWSWDFGDGSTSTEPSPTHTFTAAGTYPVVLTVSGPGGESHSTGTVSVTEPVPATVVPTVAPPVAGFSSDPVSGAAPLSVRFTDSSTGEISSWSWDFGDGSTSTEPSPTHTYTAAGTYPVVLTVSGPGGDNRSTGTVSVTEPVPATVVPTVAPPVAGFSSDPVSGAAPLPVRFTDSSTGEISSWSWDFGDGSTSTEPSPTHTFTAAGTYPVVLTVSGPGGEKQLVGTVSVTQPVPAPVAGFSTDIQSGPAPLLVKFTDTSTGDITSRTWNFGDGMTSPESSPSHTFTTPGTYPVILSVTGRGGSDSFEANIVVSSPLALPVAGFTPDLNEGLAPLTVTFTDTSIGDISSQTWDFGDGASGTGVSTTHTYTEPGRYTVTLTAGNNAGISTADTTIRVIKPEGPPVSAFTYDISRDLPLMVNFRDLSSGSVDSWSWDFGDGTTGTGKNPVHTYPAPGKYDVRVTVTGPAGTDTWSVTISLDQKDKPLRSGYILNRNEGSAPLTVTLRDTSTGDITSREWDFGDGSISTEVEPTHTYEHAGNYPLSLVVRGPGGEDRSDISMVMVTSAIGLPKAGFTPSVVSGSAPLTVSFTDQSTGTISSRTWNFGDGTGSEEVHPVHLFSSPGSFPVTQAVKGPAGESSVQTIISVLDPDAAPQAEFTIDASEGIAPFTVAVSDRSSGSVTSWIWNFGDGSSATGKNETHTYQEAGEYHLNLTVSGPGGQNSTERTVIVHLPGPALVADFTTDTTSGPAPLPVQFKLLTPAGTDRLTWNFGDGTISYDPEPSHQYTTPGQYDVTLTRTSSDQTATKIKSGYIEVQDTAVQESQSGDQNHLNTEFISDLTTGPAPLTVRFSPPLSSQITQYEWLFGDGTSSKESSPMHTYEKPGSYDVTLIIRAEGREEIHVSPAYLTVTEPREPLQILINAEPVTGPSPLVVNFSPEISGEVSGLRWDFGDNSTSVNKSPVHIYQEPGRYDVQVTGEGPSGVTSATLKTPITVIAPRIVTPPIIQASLTNGTAPLKIAFSVNTSVEFDGYAWNFGDGGSSHEQHPSHVYARAGTYQVMLTVTGEEGTTVASLSEPITVHEGEKVPVSGFVASPVSGYAPLTVSFTDQAAGSNLKYSWTFGDGNTSAVSSPVNTYEKPGTYTVTQYVSNQVGTSKETKEQYITVKERPAPPVARFKSDVRSGTAPLIVRFENLSTGIITGLQWDLGDGNRSSDINPEHRYTKPGVYTIRLTATGPGGDNTAVRRGYITVTQPSAPPVAAIFAEPLYGKEPLTVKFLDLSTGAVNRWDWEFGDGATSTNKNPTHLYQNAGVYQVNLTALGPAGTSTTDLMVRVESREEKNDPTLPSDAVPVIQNSQIINKTPLISGKPLANFSISQRSGLAPFEVSFQDRSSGNVDSWIWDFGDLSISDEQHPVHIYTNPGVYTISLTVSGSDGRSSKRIREAIEVY